MKRERHHSGSTADPRPGPDWISRSGLAAGLALGSVTGLLEVIKPGLRRVWLGELAFVPEHFWWAAPLLDAILVACVTMLAVLGWTWTGRRGSSVVRLAVPATITAWVAMALALPGLHPMAAAVLAVGAATQVSRWASRRAPQVDRLLFWSLPVMLGILPAAAHQVFRLRPGVLPESTQPPGSTENRPDILLILLDTVRAMDLSLHGARAPTSPVIDSLGARGVTFLQAFSTAPWTLPSHASVFTGRWAHELSTSLLTPLDARDSTLAEVLQRLGYATAGFSANREYASTETGIARGFDHFEDHRWTLSGALALTRVSRTLFRPLLSRWPGHAGAPGRLDAEAINGRFLGWLEARTPKAYFAFLNYYDAHAPYYPEEPHWSAFVGSAPRRPVNNPDSESGDTAAVGLQRRAYQGAIRQLDAAIGALLDSLHARDRLDRTLIIVTADHGEEFAEHGLLGHGNSLYRPSVHVPLLMAWPGRLPTGCRIDLPVSNRSIPATIMELLGEPGPFPGGSLAGAWGPRGLAPAVILTHTQRAINQPPQFPASRGPLLGVQSGGFRLLLESDPASLSLYDHGLDPLELADRSAVPGNERVVAALLGLLRQEGARIPAGITGPPAGDPPWPNGDSARGAACGLPSPPAPDRLPKGAAMAEPRRLSSSAAMPQAG